MAHVAVHLNCSEEEAETISVILQEEGFAGSSYENGELILYCVEDQFRPSRLEEVLKAFELSAPSLELEPDQNWNELWEANYKDLIVGNIHIRAPFHARIADKLEIVIDPGMAFGTGHHASTQLMIKALSKLDTQKKRVLDMGCGSGILAILASKAGASEVCALDLDPNCIDNCRKNVQLNKCNNVKIVQAADLSTIQGPFDIIMSNIIRSVNIELLHSYVENAKQGAIILLSGLLLEDETQVLQAGEALNLHYMEKDKIENWIQLTFRKP